MATPHQPAAAHHHEEHLSRTPFILGVSAFILYMGLAFVHSTAGLVLVLLGAGLFLFAIYDWVRVDIIDYRNNAWPMPAQGKHAGWYGMMFFLATEVMLFAGLFAIYFNIRVRSEVWPPEGAPHLPLLMTGINTVILAASGFTCHLAHNAIRRNNRDGLRNWLIATLVLGAIFLGLQVYEYYHLIHDGFTLPSSNYAASFYLLTGTHGFHVFIGLVVLAVMLYRTILGQFTAERHVAVEGAAIYWHFVDIVWFAVYGVVYLWGAI